MTCQALSSQAAQSVMQVANQNDHCARDSDCTLVDTPLTCWLGCYGTPVAQANAATLQAAVDQQNATVCKTFSDEGCVAIAPPCAPLPVEAACVRGRCEVAVPGQDAGAPAPTDAAVAPVCPESIAAYCASHTCPTEQLSDAHLLESYCSFSLHVLRMNCAEGTKLIAMGVDTSFEGFYDPSGQLIALGGAGIQGLGCAAGTTLPSFTGCHQVLFAICQPEADGGYSVMPQGS